MSTIPPTTADQTAWETTSTPDGNATGKEAAARDTESTGHRESFHGPSSLFSQPNENFSLSKTEAAGELRSAADTHGASHELRKRTVSKHFTGHSKAMAIGSRSSLEQHKLPALPQAKTNHA